MNQHERIRKHIRDFGSITPMEAFQDLGITKLSTRMGEMIRNGEKYSKTMVSATNRYGKKVHFMRYAEGV